MADGVFLDTVGLIALLNRDDTYHQSAGEVFAQIGQSGSGVVTTNFVLAELGNSLARTPARGAAAWLIRQLHSDSAARVIHVEENQFIEAVEFYQSRGDKHWGLVDCVSFGVMESRGLVDAFTADRHFRQAGFNCLL